MAYESFYSCAYVLGTCCKRAHQSDSCAGVWATLVCVQWYSGGVSQTWYQSSQADCRLPLAGVIAFFSVESTDGFQPSLQSRHGYYWSKDNVIGFPSHLCLDSHGICLRCETIALGNDREPL